MFYQGSMGLHVIQYPSGKYGFVGSVPCELIYEKADGSRVSDQDAEDIAQFGPGLIVKSRHIKTKVYDTQEQAIDYAQSLGYKVLNS